MKKIVSVITFLLISANLLPLITIQIVEAGEPISALIFVEPREMHQENIPSWVKFSINLPEQYTPYSINPSTVRLELDYWPDWVDIHGDSFIATFNGTLASHIIFGKCFYTFVPPFPNYGLNVTLIITGQLWDGTLFEGQCNVTAYFVPTIYIKADGSIHPYDAPILTSDNITYTLTNDIVGAGYGIIVERNNILIDGAGYTLQPVPYAWGEFDSKGIILQGVTNVTIQKIQVQGYFLGVLLKNSSNNTIVKNKIIMTDRAILLDSSTGNLIAANVIKNNWEGIYLWCSSNNKIYHNNFIDNVWQVKAGYGNIWDDGYPFGGNYWSDYFGVDLYRGPSQNESGGDGLGDTPYIIDSNNMDNYPLMGPFGGSTMEGQNIAAFPSSEICLIYDNVTGAGLTTANVIDVGPEPPSGFKLAGKYYDITTTADYSGTIRIRIVYDDSDMTLEEENSLRLLQWDETLQQWMDITTTIDTENNIVHGETSHLSIFAIVTHAPQDNTPPKTSIFIGDPKFGLNNITYLTSVTPISLTAEDESGSGVAVIAYRIYNHSYNSGWMAYTEPFYLIGLFDGVYYVDFNSTDYVGNVEPINTITVILDNTPPETTITLGEPKYVGDKIYVTPETSFTLDAGDSEGSGIFLTAYRIYDDDYDSGWLLYNGPFYLTSLTDGIYTIGYYSIDNLGNVEATKSIQITLFSWNYVFEDSYDRGTVLKINLAHKFIQFITPDKDYGIRKATYMQIYKRAIIIYHKDNELKLATISIDTQLDFCITYTKDIQTGKEYWLIDKPGKE